MPFETLAGGLELVIPTNGTTNWGTVLRNSTWLKINNHNHTGGGQGAQLGKASIVPGSLDGETLVPNLGLTQGATLTPAGTAQTIDWDTGNKQILDLSSATGPVTLTLDNPVVGATYRVKIIQGATPRALFWPAAVKFAGGLEPAQYQDANGIGVVWLEYDGTDYLADWEISLS